MSDMHSKWRLTATVPGYMTSLHHSLSNDGKKVVTIDRKDHSIRTFDVPSGRSLASMRGHEGPILQAIFSADGRTVISVSPNGGAKNTGDGTVRTWDALTGAEIVEPERKERRSNLWANLASQVQRYVVEVRPGSVNNAILAPSGRYAAVRCWLSGQRCCGNTVGCVLDLTTRACLEHFCGHDAAFERELAISPDSELLFTHGTGIHAWRLSTGELAFRIDSNDNIPIPDDQRFEITEFHDQILFSPTRPTMAVRFGGRHVEWWDYGAGHKLQDLPPSTIGAEILDLSPEGKRLIVAIKKSRLKIFDLETAQPVATLRTREDRPWSRFTPDGLGVVAASGMLAAEICDAASGEVLCRLSPPEEDRLSKEIWLRHGYANLPGIEVTPDGNHILSGQNVIHIWSRE